MRMIKIKFEDFRNPETSKKARESLILDIQLRAVGNMAENKDFQGAFALLKELFLAANKKTKTRNLK